MKNIIFLISFVCIGIYCFGQNTLYKATSQGSKELAEAKNKGIFIFTLPNDITKESVQASATYYTSFFTVDFKQENHSINISMIDNNEKNRRIITRFFTILNIQQIECGGIQYTLNDFFETFLK